MRACASLMAAMLLSAAVAAGQDVPEATDTAPRIGSVDAGVRVTSVDGDAARYQRYRDLRDGGFLEAFTYTRDKDTWIFDARADHVGYRDQRYQVGVERFGKVRAYFTWDQIPLFYSQDTRTPFTAENPATLRIPDTFQQAVQTKTATRYGLNDLATPFDLRSRRDIAVFGLVYSLRPDLDLTFKLTNTHRSGGQNWMASFGFSNAIEVEAPVDTRSTDVNAGMEWSNSRGLLRVAYDGSWFDNKNTALVWDNPIRITDINNATAYSTGDAASQGRLALWPNSTANTLSATGSLTLPAHSRVYGHLSGGSWNQNDTLLPHTINTSIAPIPLDRPTAEAEARLTSVVLGLVSRPARAWWFNLRYKYYDYDNRTPFFPVSDIVRFDGSPGTLTGDGPESFSFKRTFFDADASYTPSRFIALRAGYGREADERSFRVFEDTTEQTFRTSVDTTNLGMVTMRALFEHSKRTGSGLDEEVLDDIGEQVSLRQFDISDRERNRFSGIVQVMPMNALAVSATAGVGHDNRPDAQFGLQDNDHYFWTIGVDVVPGDKVSAGIQYGLEDYTTLQQSRQANPGVQFSDPTRNWTTDGHERVRNLTANVELTKLVSRTDIRFGYDWNHSRARYVYGLPANSTLTPPVQLPSLLNAFNTGTADVEYSLTRHVVLRGSYIYERYQVDDYAFAPTIFTLDSIVQPVPPGAPSSTFLGYMFRPYSAQTAWIGVRYLW
jgi:MtrB/PioB family decaheme-associated outer membrane protein